MLTGLLVPLPISNSVADFETIQPTSQIELAASSELWYHDCSNLTGFTDITDSSWFYPFNSSDTITSGDIGVGTSWIQANDVGSGSGWHGPVKSIQLDGPFKISELVRFDVRIGFDSSIGSQLGGIRVMLHDSNQRVICQFNIFDSWADDKQLKMPAHWAFLNGTATGTPWSEPDWVTFAPYDETLTFLQNTTGFYAIIPEIGNFKLNVGPNDDLDRVASYVSVWFAGYDGYSFCDSVYLHSISLEWTSRGALPYTWHHDCSNTTGFVSQDSWNTSWYSAGWTLDNGLLSSSGTNLSISSIPSGSGWHGPAFTYEFETTFNVSEVLNFTVDVQIDNTAANYLGRYYLYLADTNQLPTYLFTYHDYLAASTTGAYGVQYFFENGTFFAHGSPSPYSYTCFDGRMETGLDGMNVYGYVDGFGAENITILDESELFREIKYIVFMGGAFSTDPLMPSWLHDISLTTSVPIQMAVPRQLASWHHDCSNMTAFDGIGDDNWLWEHPAFDLVATSETLSSSGQYIYTADLGTPPTQECWFGPLNYHTFDTPFSFSRFRTLDVEFQIDPIGASETGGAYVLLHDQTGKPIIRVQVRDPYGYTTDAMPGAAYHYANGTIVNAGVGVLLPSPYHHTLTIKQNKTGLFANLPGVGESMVLDSDNIENRLVSHVSIWIAGSKAASSPPYPQTDVVRVHDIGLTWAPMTEVWHHDCSNTTYFEQYMDWPMDWWWETYTVSDGIMSSDGDKLAFSGLTQASGDWYGPVFAYNFSDPFQLKDLEEFRVDFVIDNSDPSDAGIISVYLCDSDFGPAVQLFCSDSWNWRSYGHNRAHYRFSNGSYTTHGNVDYITWTTFDGTIRVWAEENGDLYADVPGFGQALLMESENIETDREIYYLVIQAGRLAHYSWMPSTIDDIYVEWLSDSSFINHPEDVEFESDMTENVVTWSLSAEVGAPYEIYLDDVVIDAGTYDGQPISVNVDSYSPGTHNLTVWCNTAYGELTDLVWVTIYPATPPVIDSPPDIEYEEGELGSYITWNPSDLFPSSYNVSINDFPDVSGPWYGSAISINVDGHSAGVYEYRLSVFDQAGHVTSDVVNVIVTEVPLTEALTIDSPPDVAFEYGTIGHNITWHPSSTLPASYELYVNGELADSGSWDGSSIVVDLDALSPGIFNYTLLVSNTIGQTVHDTVVVAVAGQIIDGNLTIIIIGSGSLIVILVVVGAICRSKRGAALPSHPTGYDW